MNKHIEEMARLMCANYDGERGLCGDGMLCDHDCWAYREATHLHGIGYRKASDVAREIFAEIEKNLVSIDNFGINQFRCIGARIFAELKKKYESEGVE